jgi:hypothetical protein
MIYSAVVGTLNTNLTTSNYSTDEIKIVVSAPNDYIQYSILEQNEMGNGHTVYIALFYN